MKSHQILLPSILRSWQGSYRGRDFLCPSRSLNETVSERERDCASESRGGAGRMWRWCVCSRQKLSSPEFSYPYKYSNIELSIDHLFVGDWESDNWISGSSYVIFFFFPKVKSSDQGNNVKLLSLCLTDSDWISSKAKRNETSSSFIPHLEINMDTSMISTKIQHHHHLQHHQQHLGRWTSSPVDLSVSGHLNYPTASGKHLTHSMVLLPTQKLLLFR